MNIVERRKADIFSICVFNNLRNFRLNFHPFFFPRPHALKNQLNLLISMTSISAEFSRLIANPFRFYYIVESRAPFFSPVPLLQANYLYLNGIKLSDIFTLND
jgi:hypothetical protein